MGRVSGCCVVFCFYPNPNGSISRSLRKTTEEIDVSLTPKMYNPNDCREISVMSFLPYTYNPQYFYHSLL